MDASQGKDNVTIIGHDSTFCTRCRALVLDLSELRCNERIDPRGETCLEVIPQLDQSPYQRTHRLPFELRDIVPQLADLERTAAGGCDFCSLLRTAILSNFSALGTQDSSLHDDPRAPRGEIHFSEARYEWEERKTLHNPQGPKWWHLKCLTLFGTYQDMAHLHPVRRINVCFDVIGRPEIGGRGSLATYQRPLFSNPVCEPNVDMIKAWLAYCGVDHALCPHESEVSLPNRLVEISPSGDQCRLASTKGQSGTYVCLSHCWGKGEPPLRTTSANSESFHEQIPWHSLPRAYCDALKLIRSLGMRYIWIDSLCIIQDSIEDWREEVSNMLSTFSDACMAIATTSSQSDHDPIRTTIEERDAISIAWESPLDPSIRGTYLLSPSASSNAFMGVSLQFFHDIDPSYWNSRAWTLPEKLLSHRVLYFGARKMYMTCQESIFMEGTDICEEPNHLTYPALAVNWFWHRMNNTKNAATLFNNWMVLAQNFSKRGLTYPSDTLPALSGLSRQMSTRLRDKCGISTPYLAGLWQANLPHELCWYISTPRLAAAENLDPTAHITRHSLPTTLSGPSWAWTTHPQPILFAHLNLLSSAPSSAPDPSITLLSADPPIDEFTTPLPRTPLTLKAKLLPLPLHFTFNPAQTEAQIRARSTNAEFNLNLLQRDFDAAAASATNTLDTYALAVEFRHSRRFFSVPYVCVALLVVREGREGDVGLWRRVGLVFVNSERRFSPFNDVGMQVLGLV